MIRRALVIAATLVAIGSPRRASAEPAQPKPEVGFIGTVGFGPFYGSDAGFTTTAGVFARHRSLGLGVVHESGGVYHGYRFSSVAGAVGLDHREGHFRIGLHALVGVEAYDNSRFANHVTGDSRSATGLWGLRLSPSVLIGPRHFHFVVGAWAGYSHAFERDSWVVQTNDDVARLSRGDRRTSFGLEIGVGTALVP